MSGSGPSGFPDQKKHTFAGKRFLEGRNIPQIAITAITAGSLFVWWYRKQQRDPQIMSDPSRRTTELPEIDRGKEIAEEHEKASTQGYGRKMAEASGMMEGDRAMQGVFPTKKIVSKLDEAGLLPESGTEKAQKEAQEGK